MEHRHWAATTGAVFYALWGVVHVLGAGMQLQTLGAAGGGGLAAMVSTARPFDAATSPVPAAAAAYMGMGAFNLLCLGLVVTVVAVTLNRRNSRLGYWLNLALVGGADTALFLWLLQPGVMAWSDGLIGVSLFAVALLFSTIGRVRPTATMRLQSAQT